MVGLTLAVGIAVGVIGGQILNARQEPVKRTVLLRTDLAGIEGKEQVVRATSRDKRVTFTAHIKGGSS